MTFQIMHDWLLRSNAHGPAELANVKAPGSSCKLNEFKLDFPPELAAAQAKLPKGTALEL